MREGFEPLVGYFMIRAADIYLGSDGEATKRYYAELEAIGPIGIVATNLFRAQKCSARAKVYRGGIRGRGSYRSMAYDRKQWAMDNLCRALAEHSESLGIRYGWKRDEATVFGNRASWVLYLELPQGQVSFHSPTRGEGPEFAGDWDGVRRSMERILQFCDEVLMNRSRKEAAVWTSEDWLLRYEKRLIEVSNLTPAQAFECSHAVPFLELSEGFEDDPESAADEEMGYWTD